MRALILAHLDHALCALLLLSRLGDIGSTYLVSPTLALEANPIARRLGWPFIVLTVGACLIPYFSIDMALMALVPFLMVSASNTTKIWAVRTMGEQEYKMMLMRLAKKSRLSHALAGVFVSALFVMLTGLVICFLYPEPQEEPGYWLGAGLVLYGFVVGFYGSLSFIKLFRQAAQKPEPGGA